MKLYRRAPRLFLSLSILLSTVIFSPSYADTLRQQSIRIQQQQNQLEQQLAKNPRSLFIRTNTIRRSS